MSKRIDLNGQTFGRWTVLNRRNYQRGRCTLWECRCECGTIRDIPHGNLTRGLSGSCGCLRDERHTTHGGAGRKNRDRLYSVWVAMIARCHNPTTKYFENYGGRGISVCDKWRHDFAAWRDDMGPPPSPQHTLDRIDNDGNYEPSNCRWATRKEQSANRRIPKSAKLITYNSETYEMAVWARKVGVQASTLHARLKAGWSVERALTETTWNR